MKNIKHNISAIAKMAIVIICLFTIFTLSVFASQEIEPNENHTNATPIVFDKKYECSLSQPYTYEQDWFSFEVEDTGYITISFSTQTQSTNERYWDIRLRKQDNLYYDLWRYFVNGYTPNYTSDKVFVSKGTYYIYIESSNMHSSSPYSIEVHFEKAFWEQESNNTWQTATPIKVFDKNVGVLSASYKNGEKDWYSFSVSSDTYVTLRFYSEYIDSNSSYWDVSIRDKDNPENDLWQKFIPGSQTSTESNAVYLSAGKYFVEVESSNEYSNLPYQFVISTDHECNGEWFIVQESTCETLGLKKEICKTCGKTIGEEQIPSHEFGDWEILAGNKLIPPIIKEKTCVNCGFIETVKDWSNIWISILALFGLIGVVIGIINYIKAFKKIKQV